MTEDEINQNQSEWEDPDNWTGPLMALRWHSGSGGSRIPPGEVDRVRAAVVTGWSLVATCFAIAPAEAQEPVLDALPFDAVEVGSSGAPGTTCYLSERYIVVERQELDAVGSDFFIRRRETDRCDADSLPGDYVLRDEWASYFAGLQGDVLLLDSGTGPDLRSLVLFDLASRERLAEMSYVELIPGPDSAVVGLWDGFYLDEPAPGCAAPPGGLIPGVDSLFFVDVRSGRKEFSGRTRCAQRQ